MLTADRSTSSPRRQDEPDGAPISVDASGRIGPGSRAPKDLDDKKGKNAGDKQELELSEKQSAKRKAGAAFGYADIIEVIQHFQGLTYRSHRLTAETREVSQIILSSVHTAFEDIAQDIVRSATDAVLETFDKKSK